MDILSLCGEGVNPQNQNMALTAAFTTISSASSLSDFEKLRAAAQVIDFDSHYSGRLPKILGAEVEHDVHIPGSAYLFHFRTDLETVAEWDPEQTVVWDYKTVNSYQASNKKELMEYWSHSPQLCWYLWAMKLPFLRMVFLIKPTTSTGYGKKSLSEFSEELTKEMSKGVWTFSADIYPASSGYEVEGELLRTANRMEVLRNFRQQAIKNRNSCKGCGFFPVCSDSEAYLQDDEIFSDKIPAHEGGRYISVSQAYVFHQCEKKWVHSYCDLRSPNQWKGPALLYGAVVHDALEAYMLKVKEQQNA